MDLPATEERFSVERLGSRFVDVVTEADEGIESKVGRTRLTSRIPSEERAPVDDYASIQIENG